MTKEKTKVGIISGSPSDGDVVRLIEEELGRLEIAYETVVASAHRDPDEVRAFARGAERRGLQVIIAVAGLAAALPGVVASHTLLPVVGVPVVAGPLRGVDAAISMLQLPSGAPVATVGLGSSGPRNAALLAARLLALQDRELRERLALWSASWGRGEGGE